MRRLKLVAWTASVVVPSIMAFTACSTGLGETTAQPSDDPAVTVTGGDDDITVDTFPPARPSGRPSDGVDATAANDAVPAGMELEFESANFDLDERRCFGVARRPDRLELEGVHRRPVRAGGRRRPRVFHPYEG
ncbi:MAG: hypothetical protein IPO44_03805 [Candidatus Microthrix sp.]|nr:hypothetical protein [Candidatus Microthrix sp.]MBK9558714.1 hypothetical protein [Candidatus Microthrix sp.]